jgi:hypothetical protein
MRVGDGGEVGLDHLRDGNALLFGVLFRASDDAGVDAQGELGHIRTITETEYVYTHVMVEHVQKTLDKQKNFAHTSFEQVQKDAYQSKRNRIENSGRRA